MIYIFSLAALLVIRLARVRKVDEITAIILLLFLRSLSYI